MLILQWSDNWTHRTGHVHLSSANYATIFVHFPKGLFFITAFILQTDRQVFQIAAC